MLERLKNLWRAEPARIVAWTVAVIVYAASKLFNIALDSADVWEVVVLLLPIVLGGEAVRKQVSPVAASTPAVDIAVAEKDEVSQP